MDTTLAASDRSDALGKGHARKIRRAGKLPIVLYGLDQAPVALSVDPTDLVTIFKATGNRNTVVDLDVPGEGKVPCLAREVQRHPVSRELLHVDFLRVAKERPVVVSVPVVPVGRAAGEAIGGRVGLVRRELKVSCSYEKIPEGIEVDVTSMEVGDVCSLSEITAPDGVAFVAANDFNVVTVYGKRVMGDAEAAVEAGEEEGAEATEAEEA